MLFASTKGILAMAAMVLVLPYLGVPSSSLPPECQLYPASPCLVPLQPGKETHVEQERRRYQQRQLRIKCIDHPETEGCPNAR